MFLDYLSVSYDYDARNLDKYFHFYSMLDGQNFKKEKEIFILKT